jgi:hypothetical protein
MAVTNQTSEAIIPGLTEVVCARRSGQRRFVHVPKGRREQWSSLSDVDGLDAVTGGGSSDDSAGTTDVSCIEVIHPAVECVSNWSISSQELHAIGNFTDWKESQTIIHSNELTEILVVAVCRCHSEPTPK